MGYPTRATAAGVAIIAAGVVASTAVAQIHVGKNVEGGLHWAVAAPEGASWSLVCRFEPVTYYESIYDQNHWINRLERQGAGADRGRLPLNAGYCYLTKTGGRGPVGVALVRPGEVAAQATRDPAKPAYVGFM